MRKLILSNHVSLDGFVAGPKGEMDWIYVDDELFEYAAVLTNEADTALYGRVTFQMMDAYWPTAGDKLNASKHDLEHSSWYKSVAKYVASSTLTSGKTNNTHFLSGNIPEKITELKQRPGKNILIFGSPSLAHTLMQHNLIDEYWFFVNPVLVGNGIPLYKNNKTKVALTLKEINKLACGVIALHYLKKS